MSQWLIVRHAETQWNLEGRVQGHSDTSLSDVGLRQAQALRDRLATWSIDVAYASDLKRAMETAGAILQGHCDPGGSQLPPSPSPELREFSYGLWEGMTHEDVEEVDPAGYAGMLKRTEVFAPPGGESLRDLTARVGKFVSKLKAAHIHDLSQSGLIEGRELRKTASDHRENSDTLLIVGHGGSLRVLLTRLLGLPALASWNFFLSPASLSVVDCYPDIAVLRLLNDTSHLQPAVQPGQTDEHPLQQGTSDVRALRT